MPFNFLPLAVLTFPLLESQVWATVHGKLSGCSIHWGAKGNLALTFDILEEDSGKEFLLHPEPNKCVRQAAALSSLSQAVTQGRV